MSHIIVIGVLNIKPLERNPTILHNPSKNKLDRGNLDIEDDSFGRSVPTILTDVVNIETPPRKTPCPPQLHLMTS